MHECFNARDLETFALLAAAARIKTDYPTMHYLYRNHLAFIEHSNVLCETDFSPLVRLLSPLRKGRFKMATVERKMVLLLNKGRPIKA